VLLSTSFPSLIIIASVRLEMTVTAVTLEPTLFKGYLCYLLPRLTFMSIHYLASLTVNNSLSPILDVAMLLN
jgi:hypothetical protein